MGEKIVQLVCLGPKNYAYKVQKVDGSTYVVVKCKGITLDAKALDLLHIEKLVEIAERYCMHPNAEQIEIFIKQSRIKALPSHQILVQQEMLKVYRAVSEKRMIRGNDTLPFGWKLNCEEPIVPMNKNGYATALLDDFIAFLEQPFT